MKKRNSNPVVWFEIYVKEIKRALTFYETVFDITLNDLFTSEDENGLQMRSFPAEDMRFGAGGALVQAPGFETTGNSTLIYFGSDDCSLEEGRIEKAGGQIVRPKTSIGEFGFVVLAKDTEGNLFGVQSMA